MALNVGDLQVTLSFVTDGDRAAISSMESIKRAQAAMAVEVQTTSAVYKELKLNVQQSIKEFERSAEAIVLAAKAMESMPLEEAREKGLELYDQIQELTTAYGEFQSLALAGGGRGLGQAAYDKLAEQIGYTKEELESLIAVKQQEYNNLGVVVGAYENQNAVLEEAIRAEADLEQETNKLISAQQRMLGSSNQVAGAVEQTGGSLRTASTRMNYYIQALASGNITQTLIGQSAALAGQGVQKLQMAMASASTAGGKLAAVGSSIASSIGSMITPVTGAIAVAAIAVTVWQKWKKAQEEHAQAVRDWTAAVMGGQAGMDAWATKTVQVISENKKLRTILLENKDLMRDFLGVINADDLQAGIDLLDVYEARLEELEAAFIAAGAASPWGGSTSSNATQAGIAGEISTLRTLIGQLEDQIGTREEAADAIRLQWEQQAILGRALIEESRQAERLGTAYMSMGEAMKLGMVGPYEATQRLKESMGDVPALINAIVGGSSALRAAFDSYGDINSMDELLEALKSISDQYPELNTLTSIYSGLLNDEAAAAKAAADAAQAKIDADKALLDSGWALVDAVKAVVDATAAAADSTDPTTTLNLAKAFDRLREAAAAAGPGGLKALKKEIADMYSAGYYTAAQYNQLLGIINATGDVANSAVGGFNTVISGMVATGRAAGGAIDALRRFWGALGQTARGIDSIIASTALMAKGLGNVSIGGVAVSRALGHAIPGVQAIGAWEDLSASIGSAGAAFGGVSGGGGGGGSAGAAADAIEEVETAAEKAARALATLTAQLSGMSGVASAALGLIEAKRSLEDLIEIRDSLPTDILEAEEDLAEATDAVTEAQQKYNEAVAAGEQIIARDAAAIERLEDKLWLANKAYEAGIISATELAAVQDELDAAKDAARTNVEVADEELQAALDAQEAAQERLTALLERQETIALEIEIAERAILVALLEQVEAHRAAEESMAALKELTEEEVDLLFELARQAGITAEVLGSIFGSAGRPLSKDRSGSGSGEEEAPSSSTAGKTYKVKTGDSLWRIAQEVYGAGARYKDLISKNEALLRGRNGYPGNPMIYPGDVLKYHAGGIVPYRVGMPEVPALLKPGERVTPRGAGSGSDSVVIQNVNVTAAWPVMDSEARNIALRIRDAITKVDQETM